MKQAKKYKRKYEWCGGVEGFHHRVKLGSVYTDRQNTAYIDDSLNHFTGCPICHKINSEYWDERWEEYWSSRGC